MEAEIPKAEGQGVHPPQVTFLSPEDTTEPGETLSHLPWVLPVGDSGTQHVSSPDNEISTSP